MGGIYLHIGMEKTATTTLQEVLFTQHPDIDTSLKTDRKKAENIREYLVAISTLREVEFDRFCASHTGLINEILEYVADPKKTYVISYENLTKEVSADPVLVAHRLKRHFPAAKILLTIRNQHSIIVSKYIHMVIRNMYLGCAEPLGRWITNDLSQPQCSYLQLLKYTNITKIYENTFGEGNVCVLPIELLKYNFKSFCNIISDFMDIDSGKTQKLPLNKKFNQARSRIAYWFSLVNAFLVPKIVRLACGELLPIDAKNMFSKWIRNTGRAKKITLSQKEKIFISSYYEYDNRLLQEKLAVDLQTLGYAVERSHDS